MLMRALVVTGLTAGLSLAATAAPIDAVPTVSLDRLDFAALEADDMVRDAQGLAPRYAVPHDTWHTPGGSGLWSKTPQGQLQWQLRITSPDAVSINFGFEIWSLPDSAEMVIGTSHGDWTMRPFTSLDNKQHGELWTPPVPGDDTLICITLDPADRMALESSVVLTKINVGYRGFYESPGTARSGSCNFDVTCPETEGWEDEIPCVAVISTGGSTFCTGFMVNNLRNDRTPLFMTADHCGISSGNAASLVTYWNYENDPAVNCPGAAGETATLDQFLTGSSYLASYGSSDFTLVRLDDSPPQEWEISFCGWDAGPQASDWSVAIHHPSTDAKRWSIDYDPSNIYGYNAPGDTHIQIVDWDLGTTEPGSSGSPLFDQNQRIIGQLHGGYAACGNDLEDWYGRFHISWTGGGSPSNQLKVHLDPENTGATVCDTLPGRGLAVTPGGNVLHLCTAGCESIEPAQVLYTLTNYAPDAVSWSASISGSDFLSILGGSSGTIVPGGTAELIVIAEANGWSNGTYDAVLTINDNTSGVSVTREHILEIGLTGFETTPANDFVAGGPVGGPFTTTQSYTLTSTRPSAMEVVVSATTEWISLNGSTEPLQIEFNETGQQFVVEVGFSDAANDLNAGLAYGTVVFNNLDDLGEGDTTREVTLDVGRYTYTAYDTPLPIQDNTEFTSLIEIGDTYCVGDVDVELDISHTYIGDLIVDLESPTGVVVRLHDRSGGSEDDIATTYDDDGGTLPDGPGEMSDFVGEVVTGTWTLRVSDNAGADTGSLNSWTLKIAGTGEACPPSAEDIAVVTEVDTPVDIQLAGASSEGNPLSFVITSLPGNGQLSDPSSGTINSVPHTLAGGGDTVTYGPENDYLGPDAFTYRTNDGQPSEEAVVTIEVGSIPNPDDCADAVFLPNGSWEFDTTNATTDGNSHDECQFDGQTYNDIWYLYEACGDGSLTVSTCNAADYDTDLVLYDRDCFGALLNCNDDGDGCSGYTSEVTVNVTEGDIVLIRVGGWNEGNQGTGVLTISGPDGDCGPEPCDGDFTGDGVVGVDDLLEVVAGFGTLYGVDDILLVLERYGIIC
ncbi:MAG: proprotein convertase P-domain-containing protein [Phycisphaerales bacterium]|nr:proprotein convertase P-domain-containing protein [Phycisphaerales bacterium]